VLSGEFVNLRPLRPEDAALTLGWRNAQRALPQRRRRQRGTAGGVDRQPSRLEYNYIIELKTVIRSACCRWSASTAPTATANRAAS
jgi:hypothetical protein